METEKTYKVSKNLIGLDKENNYKFLKFVELKDISEWDVDKILNRFSFTSNKYKCYKLNELCTKITDGTHYTPTYVKDGGVDFLSAKDVTSQEINWDKIKQIPFELHQELIKRVKPQRNDILLAKNGTTGVCALVDTDREFSIYVSLGLLRPNMTILTPQFLLHIINSSFVKKQFNDKLIGIGVPNLHLKEIKELQIPLPPLSTQKEIVTYIEAQKVEIKRLKKEAEDLRICAKSDFENEIFLPTINN